MHSGLIPSLVIAFLASMTQSATPVLDDAGAVAERRASSDAQPTDYRWIGPNSPLDSYSITVVRGLRPGQVRRALAPLGRSVGDLAPGAAILNALSDDFEMIADVVQIERLGSAVVVWEPFGYRAVGALEKLSRKGVAFNFGTFPGENYVSVYRKGRLIRDFDPPFVYPSNALPEEEGLHFKGRRKAILRNVWALMERVTRRPISERWFSSGHPTWVRPYR